MDWLRRLRDRQAQRRSAVAIERMEQGKFGDVRSIGSGVSEARLHFGPGYRLHFSSTATASIISSLEEFAGR